MKVQLHWCYHNVTKLPFFVRAKQNYFHLPLSDAKITIPVLD